MSLNNIKVLWPLVKVDNFSLFFNKGSRSCSFGEGNFGSATLIFGIFDLHMGKIQYFFGEQIADFFGFQSI